MIQADAHLTEITTLQPANPGDAPPDLSTDAPGDETTTGLAGLEAQIAGPSRFSMHTILIALVLLVAGGVLYGMRLAGLGPGAAKGKTTDIVEGHTPSAAALADHKAILADLNSTRTNQQVPEEKIKKNPFRILGAVAGMPESTAPAAGDDGQAARDAASKSEREKAAKAKAEQEKRVADAARQMRLNAVIGGSAPMARINGVNYRVGDSVMGLFTINAIHGRSVEMTNDGVTYTLQMQDGK